MPIGLIKPVARVTSARIHEAGKTRRAILSLIPGAAVGVRLEGTRQTYQVDAEVLYSFAVKQHERRIEKRAVHIHKAEGVRMKTARAKARKELLGALKI